MAELVWPGKYRDGERVRAPRAHVGLRVDEAHGVRPGEPLGLDGTYNRLIHGQVPDVLGSLLSGLAGRVSLIYVDPPFDTGGAFDFQASIPGAPEGAPRIAVPAYSDARGLDAWIAWFAGVSEALRDFLTDGGSLYVHLDAHVAHYAKVVLDEVFGADAFQREIVWRIGWVSGYKARLRGWIRNHDTLLFYAKGGRPKTFHKEYLPYPAGYVRRDGKPPRGEGVPVDDVWNAHALDRLDSIQIVSFSGEKVGYPTQKNEALLARVIKASSDPGDLVLDAFVGSGTTAVVAEKLGRRWVACDASPVAIHAARRRLLALPEASPFVVERAEGDPSPRPSDVEPRSLEATVGLEGRRAVIDLLSFRLAARTRATLPAAARASVKHWSQWIDGYCIDWDHRAGVLNASSRVWRRRGQERLTLTATHTYSAPGRYVALVRAYDVLGGVTTKALSVDVEGP